MVESVRRDVGSVKQMTVRNVTEGLDITLGLELTAGQGEKLLAGGRLNYRQGK